MSMTSAFAQYVLVLDSCALSTARSEDRPIYQALLADAAGLLATSLADGARPEVSSRIDRHEQLWGQSWLQDPVYEKASNAWTAAKGSSSVAI